MVINDPHSYADLQQGKIEHIDFQITIDFDQRVISGAARYRLDRPLDGLLFLDTEAIDLRRAHAGEDNVVAQFDRDDRALGQRLRLEVPPGATEFTLEYVTSPEASALQWLPPEQTAGGVHPFLFTQCQAIHARSLFPCQDTPSVRFTYTAEVRIQHGLRVAMAAAADGVKRIEGDALYRFHMPQPVPSYLFALAAGNIGRREIGPRCDVYAEPEYLDAAVWEFESTEKSVSAAEELLGPYEWDRYDLLVLPPSFPYGGMENPRLNFITPTLLVGDRSLVDVIYHELAHAWTGNLVTNATWSDFWLNEGWTTYAERRISEVLVGKDYVQLKAAIEREEMFELMDRFGRGSEQTKLHFSLEGMDLTGSLTQIQYAKGCEFLLRLEESAGREAFDRFIQKYIQTFRFQSITTQRFVEFLQAELPEAAARVNLDLWLYAPGFPEDAPPVVSSLKDEIDAHLSAYRDGSLPDARDTKDWTTHQVHYFLKKLPKEIPLRDLLHLERVFGLRDSKNIYVITPYYEIAILSGYEAIYPRVEQYAQEVGRLVYLARVFRALVLAPWSRGLARELFERTRSRHHPVTAGYIEGILSRSGV